MNRDLALDLRAFPRLMILWGGPEWKDRMKTASSLALSLLLTTPAFAAEKCDFAYSDRLRDTVVVPAIQKTLGGDYWKNYGAVYDMDAPRSQAGPTGTITLIFHEKQLSVDGANIDVDIDPCSRKVSGVTLDSNIV